MPHRHVLQQYGAARDAARGCVQGSKYKIAAIVRLLVERGIVEKGNRKPAALLLDRLWLHMAILDP